MNFSSLSPRERALALGAAAVLLFIVIGYVGWSVVGGWFEASDKQITDLQSEIKKQKLKQRQGKKAIAELHTFRERALPETPDVARSVYQKWLLERLAAVKLEEQVVAAGATHPIQKLGYELTFTAKGRGTLPQIVQLLDSLQRPDYLHRINSLKLKPVVKSKLFDVSITLEALALEKADATAAMPAVTATRLALSSAADYEAIICGRNIFGPANQPPALKAPSTQTAYLGKEYSYTLEAKDADALDRVTYRLENPPTGLSIDPQTGKLRWQPKEKGKFEFTVLATDDGLPAKETSAKIVVNVTDPPPPPKPEIKPPTPPAPKPPSFDDAKYTILAGVTEVNDEREIWLLNRPKGELLKLRIGDKFKIGSLEGSVESIGLDDFIFLIGAEPRRLFKGETLEEAKTWDGD